MALSANDIMELMIQAKEMGLTSIKVDGFEATLSQGPQEKQVIGKQADMTKEEIMTTLQVFDDLSDDQILYWSTPYYDELESLKQAQLEASKKDE